MITWLKSMHITVINPNSNPVYTAHISTALESVRQASGVSIDCITLREAPLAIMSDQDIEAVIEPICRTIQELDASVAGVVIACFADPGLYEARRIGSRPVIGSCEAAVVAAMTYGSRLGLISTGDDVDADRELILSYSRDIDFLAIESLGIPTAEIPNEPSALQKLIRCGNDLQVQNVDAVMLGCAGMATYAEQLQAALDVPVIEATTAAVNVLLETIRNEELTEDAKDQSTATA